jgi:cell wall-associated NlpC family hydrolase
VVAALVACSHPKRVRVEAPPGPVGSTATSSADEGKPTLLTRQEGLTIADTALEYPRARRRKLDCSHLVQQIYDRAGFTYPYATSYDLFAGAPAFERVWQPQAGDLVAWRGHVGIVIDPTKHSFYSSLRSGPGIDHYDSTYWRRRGQPRFYRYAQPASADLR